MNFDLDASTAIQYIRAVSERVDLRQGLGYRIAAVLRADLQAQFSAGGIDPRWEPLSQRTIDEKRRQGYPRLTRFGTVPQSLVQRGQFGPENILIRTGVLLTSWTQAQDPHHVERVTSERIDVGTAVPYARYHQEGGPNLPKRALGITKGARAKIADLATSYVATGKEN